MKKMIMFGFVVLTLLTVSSYAAAPLAGFGAALEFDGSNDYVALGNPSALGLTTFTIECWFSKLGTGATTTTGGGGITAIPLVTKGRGESDNSNKDMNYFLGITASGSLGGDFEDTSGGDNHPITATTVISDTNWHHAAFSYDGANLRLYLDGQEDAISVSTTATPRSDSIQPAAIASALNSAGTPAGFLQGTIDDVRIWDSALSASTITNWMDREVDATHPDYAGFVAYYKLNEGDGITAGDSAGTSDGALENGPVWVLPADPVSVLITNPADSTVVGYETTTMTVQGINNTNTVGSMVWTNAANTAGGSFPASGFQFQVSDIPLALGDNLITVSGTNTEGMVESDSVTITRTTWHGGDSPVHYVATNGAAVWPYTNWTDAATCIQDAVDATASDDTVLVADGTYDTGGALTPENSLSNRVCIIRAITLQSVNGAEQTFIVGNADPVSTNGPAAMRGVYLGAGTLSGFTITDGHTLSSGGWQLELSGGGVYCNEEEECVVSNCVLIGNSAKAEGGGSFYGILNNCLIAENHAEWNGGGSRAGTLNNCTLTDNSADNMGGGIYSGTLKNCIIFNNTAVAAGDNIYTSNLSYCYTNDPYFVDAPADNYRLMDDSPCINAGNDAYAPGDADLDGNARISYGRVDIGAYEWMNVFGYVDSSDSPIHYVATNGAAIWPYTNWTDAATCIQDAVNAAASNDTVRVGDGTYDQGEIAAPERNWPNRVCILRPIMLESVNGPESTLIVGNNSVRGIYMMYSASLSGFTVTNGHASMVEVEGIRYNDSYGGGLLVVDAADGEEGGGEEEEPVYGTISNSVFSGNAAYTGGGVLMHQVSMTHCTVSGNTAVTYGGGIYPNYSTLSYCRISGNTANKGGGIYAHEIVLLNSLVDHNTAIEYGGGISTYQRSDFKNCTVSGNTASENGGIHEGSSMYPSRLYNCIVWGNSQDTGDEVEKIDVWNSCLLPGSGISGSYITNNPCFLDEAAGNYRLQQSSPCINAGNNTYVEGDTDLDGNARIQHSTVDMGVYEQFVPAPVVDITNSDWVVNGEVSLGVVNGTNNASVAGSMIWSNTANSTSSSVAAPGSPDYSWQISGIPLAYGDNLITVSGTNVLGLAASDSVTITRTTWHGGDSPVHYVSTHGAAVWPYTNWTDAATCIQDAVNAANSNDTVLVTNGVYETGGAVTPGYACSNRVCIIRAITLQSVNGSDHTFIVGVADPVTTNGPAAVRGI